MKKIIFSVFALLISLLFAQPAHAVSVDNFSITNYTIDYTLSRDEAGHSLLTTAEKITARFPEYDQNHGNERLLPTMYDNHSTQLKVISVMDETATPVTYETTSGSGQITLRIGDAGSYVHGEKTYIITYSQQDVTRYFTDTNADEFYWDTNGTMWRVPVDNLSVHLKLDDSISAQANGNAYCYRGKAGEKNTCDITQANALLSVEAKNLTAGENVTLAVGFRPHTFTPHEASLLEKIQNYSETFRLFAIIATILLCILSIVAYWRLTMRIKERGTIIPEYLPPSGINVTVAARIWGKSAPVFTAQLIDYAVRHYIKIYQTREPSFWRKAQYELEITRDITDLQAEEQELFNDIFDNKTAVGTRLDLAKLQSFSGHTAFSMALQDNEKKLNNNIEKRYGLRAKNTALSKKFYLVAGGIIILAVATLSLFLPIAAVVTAICGYISKPLTDNGLALWRYLAGLKLYIAVAETERLKMLQSPEGAAKVGTPIDTNDHRQLITLYERVLPYAVLFGQEKDWNKQLGQYYESLNTAPDWYGGNAAVFSAASFSSGMNSFSSSATSIGGSSNSGGSSGGGSSGGGGGGGGGGGW